MGTSTRPDPLTPNSAVSNRAELWLTIATRSPTAIPMASSAAAWARARAAMSAYVIVPHDSAGCVGSSMIASRFG